MATLPSERLCMSRPRRFRRGRGRETLNNRKGFSYLFPKRRFTHTPFYQPSRAQWWMNCVPATKRCEPRTKGGDDHVGSDVSMHFIEIIQVKDLFHQLPDPARPLSHQLSQQFWRPITAPPEQLRTSGARTTMSHAPLSNGQKRHD